MNYQTCRHGGKPCPKVYQALPMHSLNEARSRASCLPTIAVALFILGIAALETGVPALVGAILR
jgi:hypothetical protein